MRRNEKEITDKELIENILLESEICHIAMIDGSEPYIVPVNYGYFDQTIYMHSAPDGRKIEILKKNNRVCFEIEQSLDIVKHDEPCKWSAKYKSVIGYGNIEILTDSESKVKGLDIIMKKYGYQGKSNFIEASLNRMVLLKLKIEKVTGKKSGD